MPHVRTVTNPQNGWEHQLYCPCSVNTNADVTIDMSLNANSRIDIDVNIRIWGETTMQGRGGVPPPLVQGKFGFTELRPGLYTPEAQGLGGFASFVFLRGALLVQALRLHDLLL